MATPPAKLQRTDPPAAAEAGPPFPTNAPMRWDLFYSDDPSAFCDEKCCEREDAKGVEKLTHTAAGFCPLMEITWTAGYTYTLAIASPLEDPILRRLGVSEAAIREWVGTNGIRFAHDCPCVLRVRYPAVARSLIPALTEVNMYVPADAGETDQEKAYSAWCHAERERTGKDGPRYDRFPCLSFGAEPRTVTFCGQWPAGMANATIPMPRGWSVRRPNIIVEV